MLLLGINDRTVIPLSSYSGVYQDEIKKWELYKEINFLLWLEPNKKLTNGVARLSVNIGNKIKLNNTLHFWTGAGCKELIFFKSKNWWINIHRKMGSFFVHFVAFTGNFVHSVVWNQSMSSGEVDYQYIWLNSLKPLR